MAVPLFIANLTQLRPKSSRSDEPVVYRTVRAQPARRPSETLLPMKIALTCVLLVAAIVPAFATSPLRRYEMPVAQIEKVYTPDYYECTGPRRTAPVTMEDCMVAERERLQPRLATAYAQAMHRVADDTGLARRQAAWLAHGGDYCEAEAQAAEGDDLVRQSCLLSETARRIAWLESLDR